MIRTFLCVAAALFMSACGPYIKTDPDLTAHGNRRALMTSLAVDVDYCPGQEKVWKTLGTLKFKLCPQTSVTQALQFKGLDATGARMLETAAQFLAQYGVEVFVDSEMARSGDAAIVNTIRDVGAAASERRADSKNPFTRARDLESQKGLWISPDGSLLRIQAPRHLYNDIWQSKALQLIQGVTAADGSQLFLFIDGRMVKHKSWLGLVKAPMFSIDISLYDTAGKPLLRAHTSGKGKGKVLFIDQRASNLQLAMQRGLDKLQSKIDAKAASGTKVARQEGRTPSDDDTAVASAPPEAGEPTGVAPAIVETPTTPPVAEAPVAQERPFDPNAPPPRSLADRAAADPAGQQPAQTLTTSEPVPRSLADRGATQDPNAAPRRSLADTPGDAAGEAAPAVTAKETDSAGGGAGGFAQHRLGLALRMGFGGNASPVYTKTQKESLPEEFEAPKSQLAPAGGALVQYEYVLHPVFSVGARTEFFVWRTEVEALAEAGRHKVLNIDPMARLRIPVQSSLVYVGAMIGPSFTLPSADYNVGLDRAGARMAWNYGVLGGIEILGNSRAPSVFVEGGYSEQQVRYRLPTLVVGSDDDILRMKFWELGFNVGATYGF